MSSAPLNASHRPFAPSVGSRRAVPLAIALAVAALLVWRIVAAHGAPASPATTPHLGPVSVVLNSAILVLREGLETILVLAAVTASFRGAQRSYRRPVAVGGTLALLASVATWFIAIAVTAAVGAGSLDLQAATGLLAIAVLLLVMNWFFHKVYWTGWISNHHQRRKRLLADVGEVSARRTLLGLGLLGFTSVYREGFEVVLFLQNLRLRYGSTRVVEGVLLGLALVAVIGYLTFVAHQRLPYRRMLIATGVMLWVVLLVMVGESVQEMQQAGWLATTSIGVTLPDWMGLWLSIFANWETVIAQLLATVLVVGTYVLAEHVRVGRPRRRGASRMARERAPSRPVGPVGPDLPGA